MQEGPTPLYVRLAADESRMLAAAVTATGKSKRQLVEEAVREHLAEDDRFVVGRAELREAPPEVLTPGEAAAMLRLEERDVVTAAERGELPARRIGDQWRLSRAALLRWLDGA